MIPARFPPGGGGLNCAAHGRAWGLSRQAAGGAGASVGALPGVTLGPVLCQVPVSTRPLSGSPINPADSSIGSPITSQSTDWSGPPQVCACMLTQHKEQLDARDKNPGLVLAAANPYAVRAPLLPQPPSGAASQDPIPMVLR